MLVVQVMQIMQVSQVMQVMRVSPAHLWVDFRDIFIIIQSHVFFLTYFFAFYQFHNYLDHMTVKRVALVLGYNPLPSYHIYIKFSGHGDELMSMAINMLLLAIVNRKCTF